MNVLEGIIEVTFDLGDRMATVIYDADAADVDVIADAIDRANDLMRPEDDNAEDAGRVLG